MKKRGLLLGVLALAALLGGAAFLYDRLSPGALSQTAQEPAQTEEAEAEPVAAPDFTVEDWDGNTVSLSDFQGKPVILNFWASWCSPCKSEMPDFDQAYQTYGEDIQFMMVNLTDGGRETVASAQAFIEGEGYAFPVFFDTRSEAASAYGTAAIPVTYFVDAEGFLVAYGQGALSADALQAGIELLLPQESEH